METVRELSYEQELPCIKSLYQRIVAIDPIYTGLAYDGTTIRVPVVSEDTTKDGDIDEVVTSDNTLTVTANPTSVPDDETVSIVTCSDPAISGDAQVDYVAWLGDVQVASGQTPVVAGTVTIPFSSDTIGLYCIEIKRQTTSETGYVNIEVTNV